MRKHVLKPMRVILGVFLMGLFLIQKPSVAKANFTDVDITHPANASLGYLVDQGIIEGFSDNTFRGQENIDRAALMKVIVLATGADPDPAQYRDCFTDVQDQWFARHICYAKEQEWVIGYTDGSFRPGRDVSDTEASKIILEPLLADKVNAQSSDDMSRALNILKDVEPTDWFAKYYTYMYWANMIAEPDMTGYVVKDVQPGKIVDRSFVAELLARAMMVSEGDWPLYHPYLKDELLKDLNLNHLISSDAPCYTLDLAPHDTKAFEGLMRSKYGDQDFISLPEGQMVDPFSITACYSGNGDALLTYSSVFASDLPADLDSDVAPGTFLRVFHADRSTPELCPDSLASQTALKTFVSAMDVETLEMLDCRHFKDKNQVAFLTDNPIDPFTILEGADVATFKPLNSLFGAQMARDADHLYYYGRRVENFDFATMDLLGGRYVNEGDSVYFVNDVKEMNETVSFDLALLEDVSAEQTEVLSFEEAHYYETLSQGYHDGRWAKEGGQLYFGSIKVGVSDPSSFEVLSLNYARDKDHIYQLFDAPVTRIDSTPEVWSPVVQEADVNSFEVLSESFFPEVTLARDKDHLYFNGKVVQSGELDLSTVRLRNEYEVVDDQGFSCGYAPNVDEDSLICGFG